MSWLFKLLGVSGKNQKIIKSATKAAKTFSLPRSEENRPKTAGKRKALKDVVLDIEDLPYDQYEVVGESHYQATLEKHAGPKTEAGADHECEVVLVCERGNKFDKNAVRVELAGEIVGYLSRADAESFREMLNDEDASGAKVKAKARITGGWKRDGDEGYFGIVLDLE